MLGKENSSSPTSGYCDARKTGSETARKDTATRAREKAIEILGKHLVPPLPEVVDQEISRLCISQNTKPSMGYSEILAA